MKYAFTILCLHFCLYGSGQDQRLWATYYGGDSSDYATGIATDANGNVYMTGRTKSPSNMASDGFLNTYDNGGNAQAFLVKFNSQGNRLWATYYGGTGIDYSHDVAVDALGNVYITGQTISYGNIAFNGFQNNYGGGSYDAFLVKFDSTGNRLWGTYYGGNEADYGYTLATDKWLNVYMAGKTRSTSGIASEGFMNLPLGDFDAFIVKFDSAGNRLWATYYGEDDEDSGNGVATDELGNVYLTGTTFGFVSSFYIATEGFENTVGGNYDAFLVKFGPTGNRIWSRYYGAYGDDEARAVATDVFENVFITGYTGNSNGIASGGLFTTFGGGSLDAFLVKFNSGGNRLWSTYYGGNQPDNGNSIATDSIGNIYLSGGTYSSNRIAAYGFQDNLVGNTNDFVVKFNSDGVRECATYYGSTGGILALNRMGSVYLAGYTRNDSTIAFGGFQNTYGGIQDACLTKFSSCNSCQTSFEIELSQNHDTLSATIAPNYQWYLNGISIPGATNQTHQLTETGYYYVATVYDGCIVTSDIIHTTCLCVGIIENDFSKLIKVYPNPATTTLTIQSVVGSKPLAVNIYNTQGQQLSHPLSRGECVSLSAGKGCVIDISQFPTGLYYLHLQSAEGVAVKKFEVIR